MLISQKEYWCTPKVVIIHFSRLTNLGHLNSRTQTCWNDVQWMFSKYLIVSDVFPGVWKSVILIPAQIPILKITSSQRPLMYSRESVGPRMDHSLRNSSVKWIFLGRLPIQNHLKLIITEKRRNMAKYLTWNSIRLKSVKKTTTPNSVKSLGYIKCYSSSSPRPVKSPSNSIKHKCLKIYSWLRRP